MRLWRWWVALLSERESGEGLALFRIVTGLGLLLNVASVVWSGALPVIWIDRSAGGYRSLGETESWLIALLGGATPSVVHSIAAVGIASGVLLVLGLGGRWTALVAGQAMLALSMINSHTKGSYDALLSNALWLLFLARATEVWSIDARLRRRAPELVPAWPRYLAILQLVVMYFFNGVQKVSVHWTIGGDLSALYYILQQPTWQRFDMTWVHHVFALTQIGTAITWLFELSAPLLLVVLFLRRPAASPGRIRRWVTRHDLRIPFIIVGVSLHAAIMALLEVGAFSVIVLAFYPCVVRPEELRRVARMRPSTV